MHGQNPVAVRFSQMATEDYFTPMETDIMQPSRNQWQWDHRGDINSSSPKR